MFKVYCSHNINQIPQLKHNNVINWNKLAWNIHDEWPLPPNFTGLVHLLAECQYSLSALTTMLFIPSDSPQGNGVASPRQRYTINQISQHWQLAFVNTHLYCHYSQFTAERWVLRTIFHQCMETEYIKRNISDIYSKHANFLFKFSSYNVHPVTLSNLTSFIQTSGFVS